MDDNCRMILILEGNIPCNLECAYCYQRPIRERGLPSYNLDAVMNTVRQLYKDNPDELIVLHGGEPLLLPFDDIERILSETYKLQGHTAINTNGTLINDDLIKLFKRYKTNVAVSIDGLYPLNKMRGYPNDKNKCDAYTAKLLKTMETLISEGISVTTMIVIHKENAVGDKLKLLGESIIHFWRMGISAGKINHCTLPYLNTYELTPEELYNAWKYIAKITIVNPGIQYSPINFFLANLWGATPPNDCYMTMCDVFCTERAKVICADGSVASCTCGDHINKNVLRPAEPSFERYMALQKIPINAGGCKGCKYWSCCFGGCSRISNDWRKRDKYCEAFYHIYKFLEQNIRSFEPIFGEQFKLATDKEPIIIEEEPIHRIIKKRQHDGVFNKTVINGIKQIEYTDRIEIMYGGYK